MKVVDCIAISPACRRLRGLTLVELQVALVIGAVLVAGLVTLYLKARDTGSALDARARLQETARYAMAILEADVRLAGYWGLTNRADAVSADASLTFPDKCGGTPWVADAGRFLDGANDGYLALPRCTALGGGPRAGADVLIVRRASAQRISPQSATVAASRRDRVLIVTDHLAGEIFVPAAIGNVIPAGFATQDIPGQPPLADTRELIVNAYYVSSNSSVATGYPALRRKTLTTGPDIADEEVIAGVEDLQFQVGVDLDGDSSADALANPGSVPPGGVPVSVRIWLRVRSQERDPAYTDRQTWSYAGRTVPATGDAYRRVLISRTLQLRNSHS